ncbi:hypothetical protein SEMRO_783_G201860.1 [Seminavis robusta]|uniref:Uncharacterized protein n=1 Tax=Seminavis robusta TaxID=568900 RepID=A0A9N8HIH0_9STRA|nr:hypothetical protein SEMRO_783_G201860.1 [Seminavis robusta]|eukprot:Sro783_g201860.1 n/a (238) ;mRNA; f:9637-10350
MSSPKRTTTNSNKASSPKSAFNAAKFKPSGGFTKGRKDSRHHALVEGLRPGVITMYFKKHNCDEEPYLGPDMKWMNDPSNAEKMDDLGIHAVLYRKGVDGETSMLQSATSEYSWRQLIFVVGEDNNTPTTRLATAEKVIKFLNGRANTENYKYPKKIKFLEDLSRDHVAKNLRPLSAALLDEDVCMLMQAAYPDKALMDLVDFADVMANFWVDPADGATVMEAYNNSGSADTDSQTS